MIHFFLLALFFVLLASKTLGFDLSLAPGMSVKNAFLYLIFSALAIQTVVTRQRKLELLSVIVPFTVFALYATFTWVVVLLIFDYPGYNALNTLISLKGGPIEYLMVFLVFFYGISDMRRAVWLFRSIVWIVIAGNVITVIDALNIPDLGLIGVREDGRVGGTIGNSNEYGAFLAFFLPAIVALYLTESGFKKLLAGAGVALTGLAFLMALSRGAMVGLAVGGVLGAFYLRAHIAPQTLVRMGFGSVLLFVLVVVGGFVAGYGDLLLERFGLFGQSSFDVSSGRTVIWSRTLDSMLDHPVTFVTGFGWYAYESSRYFSFATHNVYLNFFYNLGIIGVALFLLTVGNALGAARSALNSAGPEIKPLLIGFVFGLFALLVTIFFGNFASAWLYVWAFIGISLRLAVSETSTKSTNARPRMSGIAAVKNHNAEQRE